MPITEDAELQQSAANTANAAKGRRGYTRQRTGCLTCRQRKKRCNQAYPVCGHCLRLNLVCRWEGPRALMRPEHRRPGWPESQQQEDEMGSKLMRMSADLLDLPRLTEPLHPLESELGGHPSAPALLASRRAMMRYYTASFAFTLTTNVENNCFLSVLLPMAFECPPLIYALAAFASSHLALRDHKYKDLSLRHRGLALQELKTSVDSGALSGESLVAVAMVMCSMDSISEATDTWIHHLSGAAATLQVLQVGEQASHHQLHRSFEGKWLLRNFAYHDILMSVAMDCRPSIQGDYWLSNWLSANTRDYLADTYFGFAGQILYLIGKISTLGADFSAAVAHPNSHHVYLAEAGPVEAHDSDLQLLAFHTSVAVEDGADDSDDDESQGTAGGPSAAEMPPVDLTLSGRARSIEKELREWQHPCDTKDTPLGWLAEAYRHAALIHLYRVLEKNLQVYSKVIRRKIQASVAQICNAAKAMPLGSLAECTMLFPLFMAGGEASDDGHIETIRERLLSMNRWRRFRNVEVCLDLLDEVWRLRCAGTRKSNQAKVDWLDICRLRGWKLALT